jgi:hypothetical protein
MQENTLVMLMAINPFPVSLITREISKATMITETFLIEIIMKKEIKQETQWEVFEEEGNHHIEMKRTEIMTETFLILSLKNGIVQRKPGMKILDQPKTFERNPIINQRKESKNLEMGIKFHPKYP